MSNNPLPVRRRGPARASKVEAVNRITKSYDQNLARPIKVSRRGGDLKRNLTQQGMCMIWTLFGYLPANTAY